MATQQQKSTSGPRRKPYGAQKSASGKCDCAYCSLKGGADENKSSSSLSFKKPSSLIGSVTVGKTSSTDNSLQRIAPKPDSKDSTSNVQLADATTSDYPIQKEMHKCVCGNSYSRQDNLQRHVKFCEFVKTNSAKSLTAASESFRIKCECGMGFDCVYNLVRHKSDSCTGRKVTGKPFKCECGFVLDDYESLINHQKTVCKKRVQSDATGKSIKQEGRNFLCECGLSYASYSALLTHRKAKCILTRIPVNISSNDRPHSCECGQKFSRLSDLSRHKNDCDLKGPSGNECDSYTKIQKEEEEDDNIQKPNGISCRCGNSFSSYTALEVHHNTCRLASDENAEGYAFTCGCGRNFPKLWQLSRHLTACDRVPKTQIDAEYKVKEKDGLVCECGDTFLKLCGLASHRRSACRLRTGKLEVKKGTNPRLKGATVRCKCGAQFSFQGNLNRHMRRSCILNRGKAKARQRRPAGRPKGSKRVHIQGSRVIHSKKWGIIRGPPFNCKCGASYLNYETLLLHKRTTCKVSDKNQTSPSCSQEKFAKPQNKLSEQPAKMDHPKVGSSFDLRTALKFRCACGQEFFSKFSLNGHSRHCKDYLARNPTGRSKTPLVRTAERCTLCKATFSSRAHLVRHVKNLHCNVSNMRVRANVKKIVAKSPRSNPKPSSKGLVIENVRSLANPS